MRRAGWTAVVTAGLAIAPAWAAASLSTTGSMRAATAPSAPPQMAALPLPTTTTAAAATRPSGPPGLVLRLWSDAAPGALGTGEFDVPTLTLFRPTAVAATGAAIVICPGGGYNHLSLREGEPVARWLNSLGITAGVLRYRLGSHGYHYPAAYEDVERAIRTLRVTGTQWKLDPRHIGVLGFSAGGHLASTAATHFDLGDAQAEDPIDRANSRPDVALLIYPVISMGVVTHPGSRHYLLGDIPDPKLVELLTNDRQVTPRTPPCFLVHTSDDAVVPVANSLTFAAACAQNNVPFELHIFEHGRHGFGLGGTDPSLSTWPTLAARFLARQGFCKLMPK